MNNLALAGAMATAPATAFAELRERPRFWFPLLLLTLATAAIVYWYYSIVDIDWLKDIMASNDSKMQKMPEAERAAAMGMMSRGLLLWGSVIGTLIFLPVVFLVTALYFLIAAKVTKLPQGFKHWLALACWGSLPMLLGIVVSAIFLATSGTSQLSPGVLQPLSLNELLIHRPTGSPGQAFLDAVNIPGFLAWALMIIGVRTWSQRSWAFSAILVLIPAVLIFGIWAFIAFK